MTTDTKDGNSDLDPLGQNLVKIEELTQRLVTALSKKGMPNPDLEAPGPDLMMKASAAYMADLMENPSHLIEQQVAYWGKALKHFVDAQSQLAHGKLEPPKDKGPSDPRFTSPLWDTNPYFNFVKQQYLINSAAVQDAVSQVEGLDARDRRRLEYFSRQIVDMFCPTNFLSTNPEALERALETEGQSLVDGLENLVRDIEANHGELLVTLADQSAFEVGGNIATTPGAVVFRNRMFELIQYAPTTEQVHKTPLLIFPPWINKFYIMDLKPQNSLIKWIVDQGFTLFVVSWVNPDADYADVGIEDYIQEGYLTAIEEVKRRTEQKSINVVGYCIAGTTLAMTLALLKKRGDKSVKSATFFTTLTDFADQGEFSVFLTDDFVDGIERQVKAAGYLDSYFMSRTFSYLRANDLIYRPAIRSYMMGEAPPAFDLLFWNGDSTNLPAKMAVQYLRQLCQDNQFATTGIELLGERLHISDVDVPLTAIACETDHIAAWKASYDGIAQMGSSKKSFILSQSGHIAGIVNPPSKKKYGHYTNPDMGLTADDWRDGADFHEGTWWPRWGSWLAKRSGAKQPARALGDSGETPLAPAPGTYVKATPNL
ncbi:PHA/PHB synthase family protein [Aliiroseovarius sp. PTFE2010]|uniref:PHA/PHB synthase family protein n=1 Tax=Aliiroseovarius sp. PTFE2010 TaxID=3417190 RepID=UPI003CF92AC3